MLRRAARFVVAQPEPQPVPPTTPLTALGDVRLWFRPDFNHVIFNGGNVATILNRGSMSGDMDSPAPTNSALWVEQDANFSNRPTILLDGVDNYYTLPDLSALTQGHLFVVGMKKLDPPTLVSKTGCWRLGDALGLDAHFPFVDGVIYEDFGSTTRHTQGNPADSLASPFLFDAQSSSGLFTSRLNGVQLFTTAINIVDFSAAPTVGKSLTEIFYDGWLAEVVICGTVQTAQQRSDYYAYVAERFGVP